MLNHLTSLNNFPRAGRLAVNADKQIASEFLLRVGVHSLSSVKNLAYVSQITSLKPFAMSRQAGNLTAGRVVPLAVSHGCCFCCCWSTKLRKNCVSHIDASHSRQPLVKGERLGSRFRVLLALVGDEGVREQGITRRNSTA